MAAPRGTIQGSARGAVTLAAASTWQRSAGIVCQLNTDGYAAVATGSMTQLSGFVGIGMDPLDSNLASTGILTVPASPGEKYTFPFYTADASNIGRLPIKSGTLTKAYSGKKVDLSVDGTTKAQSVDIATATYGHVVILPPTDSDLAEQMVRFYIAPEHVGKA